MLGAVDELLDSARRNGSDDAILQALPLAAVALVAGGRAGEACDLLAEVAAMRDSRAERGLRDATPPRFAPRLPAATSSSPGRLTDGFEPRYPLHEHALRTAQAALTEAGGDQPAAAVMYAAAAESWRQFGHMTEEAEALLGQGRRPRDRAGPRRRGAPPPCGRALQLDRARTWGSLERRRCCRRRRKHNRVERGRRVGPPLGQCQPFLAYSPGT